VLSGKHILLGISGGIAAYKAPELIRLLQKQGAEVKVTTTKNALEFVTTLTLQTLSGHPVYSDVFAAINEHSTEHISLPDWADLMVIAPATANVLAKLSTGVADDALTTTFAAMRKPVVIAPAMNDKMYASDTVQATLKTLSERDNTLVMDCEAGYLACGSNGKGRMQPLDAIVEAVTTALTPQDLTGKRVLITAGPTVEAIDPVRFISNHSTGKMGYSLAAECARRGAQVTLVSGPVSIRLPHFDSISACGSVSVVPVESAEQMCCEAVGAFDAADLTILCAAVADFRASEVAEHKIKKAHGQTTLTLELTVTQDIAKVLGERKRPNQTLVGFALETDNEQANAQHKLQSKHLDYIVLNSLRDSGAGFGCDTNKVTIFASDGAQKNLPLMSKQEIATSIIDSVIA
jgi:phosphopantothenoylcysteine decarboxylase/phosphopantothenate--cysteine ligase